MTKLQRIVLLLTFWFTPPTEEKYQYWVDFAGEADLDEDTIVEFIGFIADDLDNDCLKWSAFDPFVEETNKNMH